MAQKSEMTRIKGLCAICLHNWLTALQPPFPGADSGDLVNNAYMLSLIFQWLLTNWFLSEWEQLIRSCPHQRTDPKWTEFAHSVVKTEAVPSQYLCTKTSLMSWSGWPLFNIWCCNWMPRTDPSILWLKWALILRAKQTESRPPALRLPSPWERQVPLTTCGLAAFKGVSVGNNNPASPKLHFCPIRVQRTSKGHTFSTARCTWESKNGIDRREKKERKPEKPLFWVLRTQEEGL